jgi:hypothetical protein
MLIITPLKINREKSKGIIGERIKETMRTNKGNTG